MEEESGERKFFTVMLFVFLIYAAIGAAASFIVEPS
jgi:hypothetical protein